MPASRDVGEFQGGWKKNAKGEVMKEADSSAVGRLVARIEAAIKVAETEGIDLNDAVDTLRDIAQRMVDARRARQIAEVEAEIARLRDSLK